MQIKYLFEKFVIVLLTMQIYPVNSIETGFFLYSLGGYKFKNRQKTTER